MKIYTKCSLTTWPRMVKSADYQISIFYRSYIGYHWKTLMISEIWI